MHVSGDNFSFGEWSLIGLSSKQVVLSMITSYCKVFAAMMFLVGIVSCKTCARKSRDRLVIQEYQLFSFLEWSFFFDVWIVWGMHF